MATRKKATPVKKTVRKAQPSPPPVEDDNFGLPDIDYQPLNRDEATVETTEPTVNQEAESPTEAIEESQQETSYTQPEPIENTVQEQEELPVFDEPLKQTSSVLPKVIAIFLVVLIALAAGWYFVVYKPAKDREAKELAEKARKEEEAKERERLLAEQKRLEEERRRQEEAAANAKPEKGTIITLSERSKRYYVVAASSIDADLVMDYAKKLSDKGVNCKIIPPYGKIKFSRLTIAEGETFADAQKLADNLKAEHGDKLWVIKY